MISFIKNKYPNVRVIDTETLSQWLKNTAKITTSGTGEKSGQQPKPQGPEVALFDVRPHYEYEVSSIPSACRVDPDETDMNKMMQKINEIAPSSDPDKKVQVVMYCTIGYRASIMANRLEEFLKAEGGEPRFDVYNLEGSILKWSNEEREMIDGNGQETQFIHPYSKVWSFLVDSHKRKYKL